jgi:HD superfamily phosphohydrolase YqeK
MALATWASDLARDLLAELLPRRWAHSQGVARQARTLRPLLGDDADLLEAAAWLHDIGYTPTLVVTGFHPLDGARYLRDTHGTDPRLHNLVAHHSYAIIEAEIRGLANQLDAEFNLQDESILDCLTYSDMTTGPVGQEMTVDARIAEIATRYDKESPVGRFISIASPGLVAAVERVLARL